MIKHIARKRFGQNFLVDKNILSNMLAAVNPKSNDHLVEIGPGLGDLTQYLLPHCAQLDAIEIDNDLAAHLRNSINADNFHLRHQDALKMDFMQLQPQPLRIVGNLPYNISTPLLFHCLQFIDNINDMHFLLQKEVVERIAAQPGCKNYGRLSVMIQYRCKVQHLFDVSRHAFNPVPKVESAFFRLIPHSDMPYAANNHQRFALIVQTAFNHRRKTLRKSLSSQFEVAQFAGSGIDLSLRPETLSVADFVALSNCHE